MNRKKVELYVFLDRLILDEGVRGEDGLELDFNKLAHRTKISICGRIIQYEGYDVSCYFSEDDDLGKILSETMTQEISWQDSIKRIEDLFILVNKESAQRHIEERIEHLSQI